MGDIGGTRQTASCWPPAGSPDCQRLYIGKRFTGIIVVPDDKWPGMWRVRNGDHLSDMVNLARAKDAALYWARPRGLGGGEIVRWYGTRRVGSGGV